MICRYLENNRLVEAPADESVFTEHMPLIVVGVGTAGAYAVLAAARLDIAVLGIDLNSGAGGMGTYGYVSGYYYGAAGGLHLEIDQQAEQLRDALFVDTVEAKRYLLEKEALCYGARLWFEARLTGVYLEHQSVCGVRSLAGGQIRQLSCDVASDATAEAELCRMAGCALLGGRQSDGKLRPFTSVKVWLNEDGQIARTNHDSGYIDPYDA
ncbi:MAG: FAD-dependent oxidoreductase, partial [Clostridiaceae bacterium]|nr:FAD-dependent oxidoreductase [Clostridiaceae bacterium]